VEGERRGAPGSATLRPSTKLEDFLQACFQTRPMPDDWGVLAHRFLDLDLQLVRVFAGGTFERSHQHRNRIIDLALIELRSSCLKSGVPCVMSRKTPPWGEPRPALTSELIARATMSRDESSMRSWSYRSMNRSPSLFRSTPPSPRTPSVTRIPRTPAGHTIPVGWNCTISMSRSWAPAS